MKFSFLNYCLLVIYLNHFCNLNIESQELQPLSKLHKSEIKYHDKIAFETFNIPNIDSIMTLEKYKDSLGMQRPYRFGIKTDAGNISKENLTIDLI